MKKFVFIISLLFCTASYLLADDLHVTVPDMKLSSRFMSDTTSINFSPTPSKFLMQSINQQSAPSFKPLDDISWVGVPIFVAGMIAKGEKESFRQNYDNLHDKSRLLTSFKTEIDNYTQFLGPALTLGLKVAGVEGRSDWQRLMVSSGMTYGIMAAFVNGIKYTASELRPDGTTKNSWPSGHTATAFAGATILHKEYGLTRSPWYSLLGFGSATATGVMRVLNNRHWVSDVLSGAGIGILSGELAYALSDLIYKDKHLLRGNLTDYPKLDRDHPSFFDISMGIGFSFNNIDFRTELSADDDFEEGSYIFEDPEDMNLHFRKSTAVQAEGAYFFNKYVGIGGRLRVVSTPINSWNSFIKNEQQYFDLFKKYADEEVYEFDDEDTDIMTGSMKDIITEYNFSIESDHLTEFVASAGLYFNFPISDRLAIGTKLLMGRSFMQALEISAQFKGNIKDVDCYASIHNGEIDNFILKDITATDYNYDTDWDYLTVKGNTSTSFGTGLSLTYAYNGNYCWKLFCDYDYTKKNFTLEYAPNEYLMTAMPNLANLATIMDIGAKPYVFNKNKHMSTWIIGASFSVSF